MLEKIFGNATAEKVLLSLYHYGDLHASGIAKAVQIPLTPVVKKLDRFDSN